MLPLHRICFAWGSGSSIELEWTKGQGKPAECVVPDATDMELESQLDTFGHNGIPAMAWRADIQPLFEPFQLRENTDYFIDVTLPISRDEAIRRSSGNRAWPFAERLGTVFVADPSRRWRAISDAQVVISGQLRLKSHAGILDLTTDFGTPLVAEVVCRKIGYLDEFRSLLNEVAEHLAELLLQLDSPLSFVFDLSDVNQSHEAALLFQMRHIMSPENLPAAVDSVIASFHSILVEELAYEAIGSADDPHIDALADGLDVSSLIRGGPLARLFRGYTPREMTVTQRHETSDTLENRYVKYFLEECLAIAERLSQSLDTRRKPAGAREARAWATEIEEMLGHSKWAEVGALRQFPSNSQVLQKRRGYRDVLKFDLSLRLGLELSWKRGEALADGLLGDVRPISEIYEYWCFFVLRKTLGELCEQELPSDGSFLSISDDGLQVRLAKGKRSRVSFTYKTTTRRLQICLFYNRRFKRPSRALSFWEGSYTASFDPDYSILATVFDGSEKRRHWLHFDAKYRLETAQAEELFVVTLQEGESEEDGTAYDQEIARLHKRDDLFKMHTYRDGILGSRGAYILFPGDRADVRLAGKGQNLFVRDPEAFGGTTGPKIPSVGAFALCPGRAESQSASLKGFLGSVFDALLANDGYQEETGLF